MLMTNDIGNLFQAMRTAYGAQWKHGQDAMPVWLNALKHLEPVALANAMNDVLKAHVDYPPSLPQFLQIVEGPQERATTYLPPAPFDKANHEKALRDMQRLKDMPAYKAVGDRSN